MSSGSLPHRMGTPLSLQVIWIRPVRQSNNDTSSLR